jgi:hypothetical protein
MRTRSLGDCLLTPHSYVGTAVAVNRLNCDSAAIAFVSLKVIRSGHPGSLFVPT